MPSRFQAEKGRGVNFEIIHGQEAVWELPLSQPVGTMLFGHGCYHSAGDLWPPQPACPKCLGLPEEIKWRRALLERGLAVVAVSSKDRVGRKCWFEVKRDSGASMANVARSVIFKEGLVDLPVYVMGVSGGAGLALALPHVMEEVAGVYAQVRAVPPKQLKLPNGREFPPTVFVHMPGRDEETAALVADDIEALTAQGSAAAEVRILPRNVTVPFLVSRSEGHIDAKMARGIVAALSAGKRPWLSPGGAFLRAPRPSTKEWAPLVQPVVGNLTLRLDKSLVGELLNVAYARHELVHDNVDAIVTWLLDGGGGGQRRLDELVAVERAKDEAAEAACAEQLRQAGWEEGGAEP